MSASKSARHKTTKRVERASVSGSGCIVRVLDGVDAGTTRAIETSCVIGSGPDADLQLTDSTVSGMHVRIDIRDDGLSVTDLGSTNGTFYLDTRVREIIVKPGAVLSLGKTRIGLIRPDDTAPASTRESYGSIIGSAPVMQRMYAMLERIARNTNAMMEPTVLISGETGVGKELVAREIHAHSQRRDGPFEVFDASAVAPNLLESQLFGHVRGAFTGADREHAGILSNAAGGSLFLDEIGELPLDLQPKLLRVLESRTMRPVGSSATVPVDVRVIAATNRDLQAEVAKGRFREDLFFRLNVVAVEVPPLRERISDVPALVEQFARNVAGQSSPLSPETVELLVSGYAWPGNVRELRNAITRVLTVGHLPENVTGGAREADRRESTTDYEEPLMKARKRVLDAFERDYLVHQMRRSRGNITEGARLSSMDRSYFKRLLDKHGLRGDDA